MNLLQDISYCNKLASVISSLLYNIKKSYICDIYYHINNINQNGNENGNENDNENINQNEMCNDIARYYIKIAHIFSIIIIAIYPSYKENSSNISQYYLNKNKILINNINNKITLKEKEIFKIYNSINIEPLYFNETYMSELKLLYSNSDISNNDISNNDYFLNTYKNDLQIFYKIFTGNNNMPSSIKTFSDILLTLYDKNISSINKYSNLVEKYASHIAYTIKSMNQYQNKLINILKTILIEEHIDINLNNDKLNDIIIKLRKIMLNFYSHSDYSYNISYELLNAFIKQQTIIHDMEIINSLNI